MARKALEWARLPKIEKELAVRPDVRAKDEEWRLGQEPFRAAEKKAGVKRDKSVAGPPIDLRKLNLAYAIAPYLLDGQRRGELEGHIAQKIALTCIYGKWPVPSGYYQISHLPSYVSQQWELQKVRPYRKTKTYPCWLAYICARIVKKFENPMEAISWHESQSSPTLLKVQKELKRMKFWPTPDFGKKRWPPPDIPSERTLYEWSLAYDKAHGIVRKKGRKPKGAKS